MKEYLMQGRDKTFIYIYFNRNRIERIELIFPNYVINLQSSRKKLQIDRFIADSDEVYLVK